MRSALNLDVGRGSETAASVDDSDGGDVRAVYLGYGGGVDCVGRYIRTRVGWMDAYLRRF